MRVPGDPDFEDPNYEYADDETVGLTWKRRVTYPSRMAAMPTPEGSRTVVRLCVR